MKVAKNIINEKERDSLRKELLGYIEFYVRPEEKVYKEYFPHVLNCY